MSSHTRADAPGVRVVHHVPGRLRVRVDGAHDETEMLRMVRPLLGSLPGTPWIEVRPASGSVVIHYGLPAGRAGRDAVTSVQATPAKRARAALAPKLLVPLAVGLATRLIVSRRRGAPLWLEVTLVAFDALLNVERARRSDPKPTVRAAPLRVPRPRMP